MARLHSEEAARAGSATPRRSSLPSHKTAQLPSKECATEGLPKSCERAIETDQPVSERCTAAGCRERAAILHDEKPMCGRHALEQLERDQA